MDETALDPVDQKPSHYDYPKYGLGKLRLVTFLQESSSNVRVHRNFFIITANIVKKYQCVTEPPVEDTQGTQS